MPFSRNKIMPLARRLLAAKQRHPAKRAFGKWLRGSFYGLIGKNDRAALINTGKDAEIMFIASFTLSAYISSLGGSTSDE